MVAGRRYLAEGTLSDASEENKVEEINVSIEVDDLGKKNQKADRMKGESRAYLRTAADGAH